MNFDFYVLSKREIEKLILSSNDWYVNGYTRKAELSNNTPVGIKLAWLQGKSEEDTMQSGKKVCHKAFENPLGHNSKNLWNKIWED